MVSVNEEFQSTNEELLASKEELQSLNEELTALNSQLHETLERHRTTANDLQKLLFSTDVATLFLDLDLKIRFFTPAARAIFRVIPTDVGRPLADLAAVANDDNLAAEAQAVLASGDPIKRETAGAGKLWFMRRIAQLRAEKLRLPAVMLTGHGDAAVAVAALKAGASDLIEKPASAADLLASVRQAIRLGDDIRPQTEARLAAQQKFADLTAREREILTQVLAGAPNKVIAADLGINQRRVENHRAAVMRKTGAASLPALVRLAFAANLHAE